MDRATNDLPLHVATFVAEFLKFCHRCEIGSTSGIFNVISTFVYLQSYNNKTRRVVKLIVRKCLARMPLATLPLGQIKTKINPRSEALERPQLLNPLLEEVFSVSNNRQPTQQEVSNLTTSIIKKTVYMISQISYLGNIAIQDSIQISVLERFFSRRTIWEHINLDLWANQHSIWTASNKHFWRPSCQYIFRSFLCF